MLPNFIIIGTPRAGTSWLHRNISMHPEIYMPREKEINFFDRHYDQGMQYYHAYFSDQSSGLVLGEATPTYLSQTKVAELIKNHIPKVKLIAALRDPADRLYSSYWFEHTLGHIPNETTFEDFVQSQIKKIPIGHYSDHLSKYFQLFPREQMLIIFFEDIASNPQEILKQIFRFLEVNPKFDTGITRVKYNSAYSRGKLGKSKILWFLYRVFYKLKFQSLAIYFESKNAAVTPMPVETRAWLINDLFGKKNQELAELLEVDLSHWGYA